MEKVINPVTATRVIFVIFTPCQMGRAILRSRPAPSLLEREPVVLEGDAHTYGWPRVMRLRREVRRSHPDQFYAPILGATLGLVIIGDRGAVAEARRVQPIRRYTRFRQCIHHGCGARL